MRAFLVGLWIVNGIVKEGEETFGRGTTPSLRLKTSTLYKISTNFHIINHANANANNNPVTIP